MPLFDDDRLSDAAYLTVYELVIRAMCWNGVLVPPGLAQRHTAAVVAAVEADRQRQIVTEPAGVGHG